MTPAYREFLKTTSNGELDKLALHMFTLRCQVHLNREQDKRLNDVWAEFLNRGRREDYFELSDIAVQAWRRGEAPTNDKRPA